MPPFFDDTGSGAVGKPASSPGLTNARVLAVFGDSVSTDHISPAGAIGPQSPAGIYLKGIGIRPEDFNTYGSMRGNHEVMVRGTFANGRIKNLMMGGIEGGTTIHFPDKKAGSIFDVAMRYKKEGTNLIIFAGKEYGSGSSRDWAAKGPRLLGVKAIVAESFERIHRSNLVGMGVLPLEMRLRRGARPPKIDYSGEISIYLPAKIIPGQKVRMEYTEPNTGKKKNAQLVCRLDSLVEAEYYAKGGVLNYVLEKLTKKMAE